MTQLPNSRDTLLVRNTDTTRLRLTGDIVRAKQYIGVAQTYMGWLRNMLALGSVNHGARHLRLDNGVKIRMLWDGTLNIIDIFVPEQIDDEGEGQVIEIFLESGWVNIGGNIYPIDEPKPAMPLFYSDPLLEQYDRYAGNEDIQSIGKHPLASMPWLDEFEMAIRRDGALIGYLAQVREYLDTETGILSESFPEGDIQKRLTWLIGAFLNAGISTQAGKFKLLLQAQMGRNDEQGLSWVSTFAWSEPTIESTYGLYTTAEYDYFVIRAGADKMEYSPVVFRLAARRLQKLLIDNPTLDKRTRLLIESYLLSLAEKTEHDPTADVWPVVENPLTIAGTPYYYGWKMNWRGNEWAAVTKYGVPGPNPNQVIYWEGYRYKVILSEQRDKDTNEFLGFALERSEEERVQYTPKLDNTVLWYPDSLARAMLPFVFETKPFGYTATLDADAPIYCWYDDQDRLNLVRHALEQIPAVSFVEPDFANSADLGCAPDKVELLDLESHGGGLRGGFYLQILEASGAGMLDADEDVEDLRQTFVDNPYLGDTIESGYRRLDAISDFSQVLEVVQRQEFGGIALVSGANCGCEENQPTGGVLTDSTRVAVNMYSYDITNAQQRYVSGLALPFLSSESTYFAKGDFRSGDYSLHQQLGSVYGSIYFYNTQQTCYHQMFWRKIGVWGAGTIIDSDVSYSGHVEEMDIDFTLAAKTTLIPASELTDIFFSYREESGMSLSEGFVTYFPTEAEVLEASEESLGYLSLFFTPTLYADDKYYYVPITDVESLQRSLYYTPDLKSASSAVNDENLPASNFNGLFVGNA